MLYILPTVASYHVYITYIHGVRWRGRTMYTRIMPVSGHEVSESVRSRSALIRSLTELGTYLMWVKHNNDRAVFVPMSPQMCPSKPVNTWHQPLTLKYNAITAYNACTTGIIFASGGK